MVEKRKAKFRCRKLDAVGLEVFGEPARSVGPDEVGEEHAEGKLKGGQAASSVEFWGVLA